MDELIHSPVLHVVDGDCKVCLFFVGTSRTRGIMGVLNRLILSAELRLMWGLMLGTMLVFVPAAALLTPHKYSDRFNVLWTGLCECVYCIFWNYLIFIVGPSKGSFISPTEYEGCLMFFVYLVLLSSKWYCW